MAKSAYHVAAGTTDSFFIIEVLLPDCQRSQFRARRLSVAVRGSLLTNFPSEPKPWRTIVRQSHSACFMTISERFGYATIADSADKFQTNAVFLQPNGCGDCWSEAYIFRFLKRWGALSRASTTREQYGLVQIREHNRHVSNGLGAPLL